MNTIAERARAAEHMARILRHLRTAGKPCKLRDIADALGLGFGSVRNLLTTLRKEGRAASHLDARARNPQG